jgi:hypothetical protein
MMPIYTYVCPLCAEMIYATRKIEDRDTRPPICIHHPIPTVRKPDAPMGVVNGPAVRRGE